MAETEERAYRWLARTAYLAHAQATGDFDHLGQPLTGWDELPEEIQAAWVVVAKVLVPHVVRFIQEGRVLVRMKTKQDTASRGDKYEPGA